MSLEFVPWRNGTGSLGMSLWCGYASAVSIDEPDDGSMFEAFAQVTRSMLYGITAVSLGRA